MLVLFVSSFYLMYFVLIYYVYLYNVLHFILNKSKDVAKWLLIRGFRVVFKITSMTSVNFA